MSSPQNTYDGLGSNLRIASILDHEAVCLRDKAVTLSYTSLKDLSPEEMTAVAATISAYMDLATFLRRESTALRSGHIND